MSTSYRLAQEVNLQTILWDIGGATYSAAVAIRSIMPSLLTALAIVAKALAILAIGAGVVAVVAMVPMQLWLGLGIVALFAVATYPRKQVRSC